jgi:Flp pilus assembly protein TadG
MRPFISKASIKNGSVMTFFALLLPVFILLTGFVIDIGRAFVLKSELNKACLIAAQEASRCVDLEKAMDDGSNIIRGDYSLILREFFYKNFYQRQDFSITSLDHSIGGSRDDPRYVQVSAKANSHCFFLRMIGIEYIVVNAEGIGRLRKIK